MDISTSGKKKSHLISVAPTTGKIKKKKNQAQHILVNRNTQNP